jgi:Leucine-rich repeat (LRR) protein
MENYDYDNLWHNKEDKELWASVEYERLVFMLSLEDKNNVWYHLQLRDLAREYLLEHYSEPSLDENPLQKGSELVVVGKTYLKQKELKERLEAIGIKLKLKISDTTTHILLGTNPSTTKGLENLRKTLISIEQLQASLDAFEQPYLQSEEESIQTSVQHLSELLMSKEDENISIAIEIMKGGGFPREVFSEAFIALKKTESKTNKDALKKILNGYVSEKGRKGIRRTLGLDAGVEYKIMRNIKKYTQDIDELDGLAVARLLYKYYGSGFLYIFKFSKDSQEIKRILEDFIEGNQLKIYHKRITFLPKEIAQYKDLEIVNLSLNQFSSVPKVLEKLEHLHTLVLSYNSFSKLGNSLQKMKKLRHLDLRGVLGYRRARFIDYPELFELKQLKTLELSHFYDIYEEDIQKLKNALPNCTITFH